MSAAGGEPDGLVGRVAALRLRLIQTVPAVRGRALQLQLDAQREIAGHLRRAFPAELDEVSAGALVGAFIGAVTGPCKSCWPIRTPTLTRTTYDGSCVRRPTLPSAPGVEPGRHP